MAAALAEYSRQYAPMPLTPFKAPPSNDGAAAEVDVEDAPQQPVGVSCHAELRRRPKLARWGSFPEGLHAILAEDLHLSFERALAGGLSSSGRHTTAPS